MTTPAINTNTSSVVPPPTAKIVEDSPPKSSTPPASPRAGARKTFLDWEKLKRGGDSGDQAADGHADGSSPARSASFSAAPPAQAMAGPAADAPSTSQRKPDTPSLQTKQGAAATTAKPAASAPAAPTPAASAPAASAPAAPAPAAPAPAATSASPASATAAPAKADPKSVERNNLLKEINNLCGDLWMMELDLIKEAGEVFNRDEFKSVPDPRNYTIDDPKRWSATIEVARNIKEVKKLLADEGPQPAGAEGLKALDKKIAEGNTRYWQQFEKTKEVDPHWYHAATTYLAATDVIQKLVEKEPTKSTAILNTLAEEHSKAPQTDPAVAKTYEYQLQHLAPRMTDALVRLLESHGVTDADKAQNQPDEKAAMQARIDAVRALGKTWEDLNQHAGTQPEKLPAGWETRYAGVHEYFAALSNMLAPPETPPGQPAASHPAGAPAD